MLCAFIMLSTVLLKMESVQKDDIHINQVIYIHLEYYYIIFAYVSLQLQLLIANRSLKNPTKLFISFFYTTNQ